MKSYESDFCYEGSEAQKADLAADQAASEGKWEAFMSMPSNVSAEIIRQAQMPERPPEYRDFKGTTSA